MKRAALQFFALACFQLFESDGSLAPRALWDILLFTRFIAGMYACSDTQKIGIDGFVNVTKHLDDDMYELYFQVLFMII